MRSIRGMRNLHVISAAVVLVVVVGVGCGGDEASSRQELPDGGPQRVATFVGDGLVPGDQRAPNASPVTTTPTRPIGRPLRPVPAPTPVTRTPPATTTTAPVTPG
jgi:hypothetical protein